MTAGADPAAIRILGGLKRLFRPIRPVVLPIWHRLQPIVDPSTTWQPFRAPAAATTGRIRPVTKAEFDAIAREHSYYRVRGRYISVAAKVAGGAHRRPRP